MLKGGEAGKGWYKLSSLKASRDFFKNLDTINGHFYFKWDASWVYSRGPFALNTMWACLGSKLLIHLLDRTWWCTWVSTTKSKRAINVAIRPFSRFHNNSKSCFTRCLICSSDCVTSFSYCFKWFVLCAWIAVISRITWKYRKYNCYYILL